jgi:hypothetical protein
MEVYIIKVDNRKDFTLTNNIYDTNTFGLQPAYDSLLI